MLVVARAELAHDSETGHPRQAMPDVERDLVGATLVVARVEAVHGFETGRDEGVPYSPRRDHACVPGTVHEFGTERSLFPARQRAGTRGENS